MKIVMAHSVIIILMAYILWGSARGQFFEDPTRSFEKFEFDMMNRGSYNISTCLRDLLNCLELVKPDIVCFRWVKYDTVCPSTRELCHDALGDLDGYTFRFEAKERECNYDNQQEYTF